MAYGRGEGGYGKGGGGLWRGGGGYEGVEGVWENHGVYISSGVLLSVGKCMATPSYSTFSIHMS